MAQTFFVINIEAIKRGAAIAVSITAPTVEVAVERLGAELGDALRGVTKGWNLKVPHELFEPLTEEMDSELYAKVAEDDRDWKGGCYVYRIEGVIVDSHSKDWIDRKVVYKRSELWIMQPQVF